MLVQFFIQGMTLLSLQSNFVFQENVRQAQQSFPAVTDSSGKRQLKQPRQSNCHPTKQERQLKQPRQSNCQPTKHEQHPTDHQPKQKEQPKCQSKLSEQQHQKNQQEQFKLQAKVEEKLEKQKKQAEGSKQQPKQHKQLSCQPIEPQPKQTTLKQDPPIEHQLKQPEEYQHQPKQLPCQPIEQQQPNHQAPEQQEQVKPKCMYTLNEFDVARILTAISALDAAFVSRVFDLFQHADSRSKVNEVLKSESLGQEDQYLIIVNARKLNLLPWTFALMAVEYYNKQKK